MRRTCDHGRYTPGKCRKRARFAIQYREKFATRIGPSGDEPIYQNRMTFRCAGHDAVPDEVARMSAKEAEEILKTLKTLKTL